MPRRHAKILDPDIPDHHEDVLLTYLALLLGYLDRYKSDKKVIGVIFKKV